MPESVDGVAGNVQYLVHFAYAEDEVRTYPQFFTVVSHSGKLLI